MSTGKKPLIELISIHIPKTGGTSFRDTLKSIYGENGVLRLDIPIPGEQTPFLSVDNAPPEVLPASARVIHGHFRYRDAALKYHLPETIPIVTWLRDPVDRVISNYFYLSRILKEIVREDQLHINVLSKMQRSLMEYARADINRNRMSRFLEGLSLEQLSFFGIQEHMEEDLPELARLLGWDDYKLFHHNKTGAHPPRISPEMREEIARLNEEDVKLYQDALRIRQGRAEGAFTPAHKIFLQTARKTVPEPGPRILIEASKLTTTRNMDGCKRYVNELLCGLARISENGGCEFQFDVHLGDGRVVSLSDERLLAGLQKRSASDGPFKELFPGSEGTVREPLLTEMRKLTEKILVDVLPPKMSRALMHIKHRLLGLKYDENESGQSDERTGYQLIHLTLPNTYHFSANYRANHLLTTVHDLSHLECPHLQRKDNVATLKEGLDFTVSRKSAFIAVSNATRDSLLSAYNVSPEAVFTIYEACDRERFKPIRDEGEIEKLKTRYKIPDKPYFLSLGTLEPRKNLANTIKAFNSLLARNPKLDMVLVVAGQKGWKVGSLFDNASLQSNRIIFTGFVDDQDLPGLYSGARAFCYVSHYEGFGLPALEAMHCGTPVIFGNNSSMPEVVRNGGLPADAGSVDDIGRKMELLALDDELRKSLARNALERASIYSWEETVRKTLDAYRAVLQKVKPIPKKDRRQKRGK